MVGLDRIRRANGLTYPRPVWRLPIVFVVVPHFVEIILVQLSDETGKVAVLEVLGEYVLSELLILFPQLATDTTEGATGRGVLRVRQSCRHRSPIVQHSRRSDSPASCRMN